MHLRKMSAKSHSAGLLAHEVKVSRRPMLPACLTLLPIQMELQLLHVHSSVLLREDRDFCAGDEAILVRIAFRHTFIPNGVFREFLILGK